MLRHIFVALISLATFPPVYTQSIGNEPELEIDPAEPKVQLHFLSSNYLEGRRPGTEGNIIAAEYIASHFATYGLKTPPGQDSYFQEVTLLDIDVPETVSMSINKNDLVSREDFLILAGPAQSIKAMGVFAGHGWIDDANNHNDYANLDVEGKVVFVLPGSPGSKDPTAIFRAARKKRELAEERGAVALIELFQMPFPWDRFVGFFGSGVIQLADGANPDTRLVYGWLNESNDLTYEAIQKESKLKVKLQSSGWNVSSISTPNVMGIIEGSDPKLRDEYLLITAHYDHLGADPSIVEGDPTADDMIFNGARDNGIGTVCLLQAAKALSLSPPSRSVILLAVTAEEMGLLGSEYYANNPLVPLEKTIFNLNTDGAGYNTTDGIAIIGWDRTGTNEHVENGVRPFGLEIYKDPVPGLFDLSDNVSFAQKGVPCLTFSPGFTAFDDKIMQYYHQLGDEAESVDYAYLTRLCQAFAHTARMVANTGTKPQWVEDDKYESVGKELYGGGKN